jgi:hypothetical protein
MRRRLGACDEELAYSEILKLRVRAMQNCDSVCSDTTKLLPTVTQRVVDRHGRIIPTIHVLLVAAL